VAIRVRQIDRLVYELYGLTEEEIGIVACPPVCRKSVAGLASLVKSSEIGDVMRANGAEYEHEVLDYLNQTLPHLALDDYELASPGIQSGSSNRRAGVSGYRHQIDISAEYEKPGERCLLLVECKAREVDKIGLETVLVFLGRIADIEPHYKRECNEDSCTARIQPLMYARNGYTGAAKTVAEKHGIALLYLSEHGAILRFMGTQSVLIKPPVAEASASVLAPSVTTTST